jgi:hypothetical protein
VVQPFQAAEAQAESLHHNDAIGAKLATANRGGYHPAARKIGE